MLDFVAVVSHSLSIFRRRASAKAFEEGPLRFRAVPWIMLNNFAGSTMASSALRGAFARVSSLLALVRERALGEFYLAGNRFYGLPPTAFVCRSNMPFVAFRDACGDTGTGS